MASQDILQGSYDDRLTHHQQQLQPLLSNNSGSTTPAAAGLYSSHISHFQDFSGRQGDNEHDEDDGLDSSHTLPSLQLYAVHALCTFDERLYEFASYFFIMEIFKTTLLPMSIYGFSTTVAGILFSTTVGSIVDTTPRLSAVQAFLFIQKLTTVIGALGFWILLTWFDPTTSVPAAVAGAGPSSSIAGLSMVQGYGLFALMVVASGVLKLSALGWSISIERDWVVALCHSNSEALTRLNVTMKRIDLVCKLISPLVFAGLLTYLHAGYCSLIMAVWCMGSFLTEWVLVRRIWDLSPVLWQPRSHNHPSSGSEYDQRRGSGLTEDRVVISEAVAGRGKRNNKDSGPRTPLVERDIFSNQEHQSLFATDEEAHERQRHGQPRRFSLLKRGILSFRDYSHHIIFLASLAYAIIYINMMSVSGTMIGYLQYRHFSAGSIATLKGICTVSELLGTILMPVLTRYVGLIRGGAWSIWLEVLTLTPVLFSIYSDQLPVQVFIFAGMALSRIGVWSFDLVITQIMQEYIQPSSSSNFHSTATTTTTNTTATTNNAGVINGWHYSLMNLFELAQFFLTMVWSDPQVYYIPCTISFICVVIGAVVYTVQLFRMRGHLFHYHRIVSSASGSGSTNGSTGEENDGDDGQPESSQSGIDVAHREGGVHDSTGVVSRRPIH